MKHSLQRELEIQRLELEKANHELRQRNREIQGFHHVLSHELKTPLTSAISFLEFLSDGSSGPLNDQQREHLQIVAESSQQIVTCIDDLLDISRMESGKLTLEQKPDCVSSLIQTTVTSLSPVAELHGIELHASTESDLPQVVIDRRRIIQVLTNLVNNALKFTPKGGRVEVTAEVSGRDPDMVQVVERFHDDVLVTHASQKDQ